MSLWNKLPGRVTSSHVLTIENMENHGDFMGWKAWVVSWEHDGRLGHGDFVGFNDALTNALSMKAGDFMGCISGDLLFAWSIMGYRCIHIYIYMQNKLDGN